MTELAGPWRFHAGDDSKWSNPSFDDTAWQAAGSDKIGLAPGELRGAFAWYRTRIAFPSGAAELAFEMPSIEGAYEVFVNGERIGGFGRMPPQPRSESGPAQLYPIPARVAGRDGNFSIAIRVWYFKSGPGLSEAPRIGNAAFLSKWNSLEVHDGFWRAGVSSLQFPLELLGALAGFVLFALSRSEREYLWYGMLQLTGGLFDATTVYVGGAVYPTTAAALFFTIGTYLFSFFVLLFVFDFLAIRKGWMYRVALTAAIIQLVSYPLVAAWQISGSSRAIPDIAGFTFTLCLVYFLVAGAWRRNPDAGLLLIPLSLYFLFQLAFVGVYWATRLDINVAAIDSVLHFTVQWPFPFTFFDATQVLMVISTTVLIIFRFVRVRSVNREIAAEMEAARTVQQILIPEEIPTIPGLLLECVYKPAGQVGGDFFQILPTPNSGALIVIGDVSGKGMPAAMAVSLLVGTVRTLAHYTQSPAQILTAMNQRMLGRSKDGFTTCLVLRLDPDGSATLANAGHLAPYQGSKEVPVESGLPLGLAAEADYTETTFHLDPDTELTLLTDGVAEARAASGELFGFERTASIATLSAQHIAATAQAFGQQDDITVLKVHRCPIAPAEATNAAANIAVN